MNCSDFSKEELLGRIEELEVLNRELLAEKERETRLEYAWTGNLGQWYWNIRTNRVTFNPLKVTTLGYGIDEIPEHVTFQFFTDKLHPEDYPKTMEAMRSHLKGESGVYEAEYRIRAKNGAYKWYYDRGRITQHDENGKPLFLAGIVFDITEKKEAQLELEYKNKILAEMSSIDGLTKINNHRTLIEFLKTQLSDSERMDRTLSIAIFDIDDFKKVNDNKGHVFGDQVLVEVAALIKSGIRETDMAGRYGGEEFMVIFPDTDLGIASILSERIRQSVENHSFADDLRITISGGVKQYRVENHIDLIHSADKNLYDAKRRGKNQIAT